MKADAATEAEVMAVANQLKEAFNNRDLNIISSLFAPDPDVVFYGTGADEKGMGLAGVKADWERAFAQSEESSMELEWSSVSGGYSSMGSFRWYCTG